MEGSLKEDVSDEVSKGLKAESSYAMAAEDCAIFSKFFLYASAKRARGEFLREGEDGGLGEEDSDENCAEIQRRRPFNSNTR